jgi:hypothetical protein
MQDPRMTSGSRDDAVWRLLPQVPTARSVIKKQVHKHAQEGPRRPTETRDQPSLCQLARPHAAVSLICLVTGVWPTPMGVQSCSPPAYLSRHSAQQRGLKVARNGHGRVAVVQRPAQQRAKSDTLPVEECGIAQRPWYFPVSARGRGSGLPRPQPQAQLRIVRGPLEEAG